MEWSRIHHVFFQAVYIAQEIKYSDKDCKKNTDHKDCLRSEKSRNIYA